MIYFHPTPRIKSGAGSSPPLKGRDGRWKIYRSRWRFTGRGIGWCRLLNYAIVYGVACIPLVAVLMGVSFWRLRRENGLGKELFGVVGAWALAALAVPILFLGYRYGGLIFAFGLGLLFASPLFLGWSFYRVIRAPKSASPWSLKQLILGFVRALLSAV